MKFEDVARIGKRITVSPKELNDLVLDKTPFVVGEKTQFKVGNEYWKKEDSKKLSYVGVLIEMKKLPYEDEVALRFENSSIVGGSPEVLKETYYDRNNAIKFLYCIPYPMAFTKSFYESWLDEIKEKSNIHIKPQKTNKKKEV